MAVYDYTTEKGKQTRELLFGTNEIPSAIDDTDAEYQQLVANFIWNGMYSREVVPQKVRELLAVACLTALFRPEELRMHIRAALRLAAPEEVREAIIQAGVYGGFPTAVNGLRMLNEVMKAAQAK